MNGIMNRVRTWLGRSTNGHEEHALKKGSIIDPLPSEPRTVLRIPKIQSRVEQERDDCLGPARCRHCGTELELVCPAGHGGADEVLADMVAPKRAPAPVTTENPETLCSVSGCNSPRMPWKGRGRKPTRCETHLTKHPEQKRAS